MFQPLAPPQLNWRPAPKAWSILQCFDHLNLTHDYYLPKIRTALAAPRPANPANDIYKPSFWGRVYMYFALNPRYSFPAPDATVPQATASPELLAVYLAKQEVLLRLLEDVAPVNLSQTPIPIEKGVKFNLGDCLKILVYHDELHLGQAQGVLAQLNRS